MTDYTEAVRDPEKVIAQMAMHLSVLYNCVKQGLSDRQIIAVLSIQLKNTIESHVKELQMTSHPTFIPKICPQCQLKELQK